jgi:microcystin-dependent protein
MTEQIPPTPDTPEVPQQVTMDLQQLAKMMAEESVKAAQDAIATIGLYPTRGEGVAKDADEHVQVRRETALNDDGSAGDPDPGFYPVPSPGTLPQVGDTVWCVGNNGGLVVLGKEADAAYKDLPAVLAVANLALAQPPIGVSMDWNGAADPADGKWLIEDGRLLDIAAYPDLYAVLGTTFNLGGESVTQFRIPDKRGRTSVGAGQGTGLPTDRARGLRFGAETHTLDATQMPTHAHSGATGTKAVGHTHHLSITSAEDYIYNYSIANDVDNTGGGRGFVYSPSESRVNITGDTDGTKQDTTHDHSITSAGSGLSHNNMQPSLARHSIIRAKL